jgi:hypothetical protein
VGLTKIIVAQQGAADSRQRHIATRTEQLFIGLRRFLRHPSTALPQLRSLLEIGGKSRRLDKGDIEDGVAAVGTSRATPHFQGMPATNGRHCLVDDVKKVFQLRKHSIKRLLKRCTPLTAGNGSLASPTTTIERCALSTKAVCLKAPRKGYSPLMHIVNFHHRELSIPAFSAQPGQAWCWYGANGSGIERFLDLISGTLDDHVAETLELPENVGMVSFRGQQEMFE